MLLDDLLAANPSFCKSVMRLHQQGDIDPGSFVIDIDGVRRNARALAEAAASRNVELWLTAKHIRCEPTALLACLLDIPKFAAVNWQEAVTASRLGFLVANVGHLMQVPVRPLRGLIDSVRPEHVTVGNLDFLATVSEASSSLGIRQRVLLRVARPTEDAARAQGGGFAVHHLRAVLREAETLPGVEVAGVTLLGAIRYSRATQAYEFSENADRLHSARELLERSGIVAVTSYAGNMCLASLPLLPSIAGVIAEPGHAITGTTPDHDSVTTAPRELPSLLFVTEVASAAGRVLLHGGGLYPYGLQTRVAIAANRSNWTTARLAPVDPGSIPYYLEAVDGDKRSSIGDTALIASRPQLWTSRSPLVVIDSMSESTARIVSPDGPNGGMC